MQSRSNVQGVHAIQSELLTNTFCLNHELFMRIDPEESIVKGDLSLILMKDRLFGLTSSRTNGDETNSR
jgi:hypothetical protein